MVRGSPKNWNKTAFGSPYAANLKYCPNCESWGHLDPRLLEIYEALTGAKLLLLKRDARGAARCPTCKQYVRGNPRNGLKKRRLKELRNQPNRILEEALRREIYISHHTPEKSGGN